MSDTPREESPILYEKPGALARYDRPIAWGLFGLALLLRAAYVKQLRDSPFWSDLPVDLGYYRDWALRIASGAWETGQLFEQSPLYAYILALQFKLFGPGLLAPRLLQIVIGSFTCVLIWRIGRKLLSPGAGLAAGLLAAFYGPFLFYDGMLMKEVFAVFFMTAMIDQLVTSNGSQRGLLAIAGLCLGLGALVRDNLILVAPAVLMWLVLDPWLGGKPPGWSPAHLAPRMTSGRPREGLGRAAAFLTGLLIVLVPVMARNYHVSREWVLLTTGGGEVFFIGNNENADGRYSPPPFVRASSVDEHEDFRREAARRLGVPEGSIGRKRSSDYWLGQGLAWIRSHPGEWIALTGRKLLIFLNHVELPDNHSYEQHRRLLPLLSWPLLTFGALLPLAAAGVALTASRWRDLMVLYLVEAVYIASVLLFFNFGRFRMPAIPILLVLGGAGIAWLGRLMAERRWPALGPAAAVAVVAIGVTLIDIPTDPVHWGQDRAQTAEILLRAGRRDEARREIEQGLRLLENYFVSRGGSLASGGHGVPPAGRQGRPDLGASFYAVLAEAYQTRATVARQEGSAPEAAAWEARALAADPAAARRAAGGSATGVRSLVEEGTARLAAGRYQDAAASFRQALDRADSDEASGSSARLRIALRLAEALHRSGQPREALDVVEDALDASGKPSDADMAAAHYGEALIYKDLNQPELMRHHMRECLRLDPKHPRAAWMQEILAQDPLSPRPR